MPSNPTDDFMAEARQAALTVNDVDLLCDRFPCNTALRATTEHGSHVFDVVAVEQDEAGRVLFRLRTV